MHAAIFWFHHNRAEQERAELESYTDLPKAGRESAGPNFSTHRCKTAQRSNASSALLLAAPPRKSSPEVKCWHGTMGAGAYEPSRSQCTVCTSQQRITCKRRSTAKTGLVCCSSPAAIRLPM